MGKYDYNNMSFIAELLARLIGVFVDVGANIGTYTLVASEVPAARVISIEPHPATFAGLVKNVKRNHRENVVCVNTALSDHLGSVLLTDRPDSSVNRVLQSEDQGCQSVTVPCRTMAGLCSDLRILPDLVKIDVEGHERAVLDGFGDAAASCKAAFIEGGDRPAVSDWMKGSGFRGPFFVHFKKRVLSRKRQARTEDPIFIRESLVSRLRDINFDFTEQGVRERA